MGGSKRQLPGVSDNRGMGLILFRTSWPSMWPLHKTGVNPDIGQKIIEFNAQSKTLKRRARRLLLYRLLRAIHEQLSQYLHSCTTRWHELAAEPYMAITRHQRPTKLMGSKHVNNKPRKRPVDVRHEYYNRIPASYDLHNFSIIPHGLAAPKPFTNAFNGSKVGDLYAVRLERKPWFRDRKIAKMQMHGFAPGTPEIVPFKNREWTRRGPQGASSLTDVLHVYSTMAIKCGSVGLILPSATR